ncbi:MAG: type II toxin-antitoxin system VapC family toxin [Candidatus Xenobia bacterium]
MLKTFVDTGAFCAFSDRTDSLHVLAVQQFAQLLRERVPLVITNFIVNETYTWLRYRLGFDPAVEFLKRIRQSEKESLLEVVTVDYPLEVKAIEVLEQFSDQDLSYTDAASLALIQKRKLKRAFTFDHHFHLIPVQVIPGLTR